MFCPVCRCFSGAWPCSAHAALFSDYTKLSAALWSGGFICCLWLCVCFPARSGLTNSFASLLVLRHEHGLDCPDNGQNQ